MDDFAVKPGAANLFGLVQGEANTIRPGKRPLSSMTPTIVEKDGRPIYVLGSPGGPRIITAVLETLMNLVDFGMPAEEIPAGCGVLRDRRIAAGNAKRAGGDGLQPQGASAVGRRRVDRDLA